VIPNNSYVLSCWILFFPVFAASGSLSAKTKKGARGKAQTGGGTIKIAEELGACVGGVREHGSCDSIREDKTNA
jgi:hypothetical protein